MVKKQLFSARRGLAIIVALSMVMSHGVTALAEENVKVDTESTNDDGIKDKAEVNSAESHTSEAAVEATSTDSKGSSVTVSGDVKSTVDEADGSGKGVEASSTGQGSSTNVDVGGSVSIEVTENTDSNDNSNQGNDTGGGYDTISNGSSYGYSAISVGDVKDGGSVDISVGKDVSAKSNNDSDTLTGITLGDVYLTDNPAISNGKVNIDVGGSVISEGGGTTKAISGSAGEGSDVTINVKGDVEATKAFTTEAINIEGTGGKLEINVGGNVIQQSEGEPKEYEYGFTEYPGGVAIQLGDGCFDNADIDVTVAGNVIASNTAVNINKYSDKSEVDLVVKGTLEGGKHNIVLNSGAKTEDLNITVWKVDTSKKEAIVENYSYDSGHTQNTTAEKYINYIIKVDDVATSGGKLAVDKTPDSNGLYTGKQGESVYLKVTVPSGYAVDSFYNVKDATNVNVVQDSSGNYYLVVPRGGGVYVGVKLKESGSTTNGESRTESGASDGEYWSPSSNNNGNASGAMAGYAALQGLQVHSMSSLGTDMVLNVADILMPVDTLTAINNFMGNNVPTLGSNNVMGAGVVSFNNMFLTSVSDTVEVPVAANVAANQSYTVIFSDGTQVVVPCLMNGVLSIPFNKAAEGLTYIIYGVQMDPSMFIGMPMENV